MTRELRDVDSTGSRLRVTIAAMPHRDIDLRDARMPPWSRRSWRRASSR